MLKTKTFFCTSLRKTTSKHHRIQGFWLYFAKKEFLWLQTKTAKAPPPSWLLFCLGRSMACGKAYVSRLFLNTMLATLHMSIKNNTERGRQTLPVNRKSLMVTNHRIDGCFREVFQQFISEKLKKCLLLLSALSPDIMRR